MWLARELQEIKVDHEVELHKWQSYVDALNNFFQGIIEELVWKEIIQAYKRSQNFEQGHHAYGIDILEFGFHGLANPLAFELLSVRSLPSCSCNFIHCCGWFKISSPLHLDIVAWNLFRVIELSL